MDSGLDEEQARKLFSRLLTANGCSEWRVYESFRGTAIMAWPDDGDAGIRHQLFLGVTYTRTILWPARQSIQVAMTIQLNGEEKKSPFKSIIEHWILDMQSDESICLCDSYQNVWKTIVVKPLSSIEELEIAIDLA